MIARPLHRIYQHESRRLLGVALRIVRDRVRAEDVLHDALHEPPLDQSRQFDATRGEGRAADPQIVPQSGAVGRARQRSREVSADEDAIEAIEAEVVANAAPMAEAFEINADLGRLTNAWEARC